MKKFKLKIHISNTRSSAFLMHKNGQVLATHQSALTAQEDDELGLTYDPLEIIYSVRSSIHELFQLNDYNINQIDSISIICKAFGLVIWEKTTGLALKPVLYFDKSRVSSLLSQYSHGKHLNIYQDQIKQQLYPHNLAIHLKWLMKYFPEIEKMVNKKSVWVTGIDSWLLYNMTGMEDIATDYSSAMTTYLFDSSTLDWSSFMLEEFSIPKQILPRCKPSFSNFGSTKGFIPLPDEIPITEIITDNASRWNHTFQPNFGDVDICFHQNNIKITVNIGRDKDFVDLVDLVTLLPNSEAFNIGIEKFIPYLSWPESLIQGSLKDFLSQNIDLSSKSAHKLFIIPATTNLVAQENKIHIIGLTNDVTTHDLTFAYLEALFYKIKYELHQLEKKYNIHLKQLFVSSEYDLSNSFLDQLANTLQMSLTAANKVNLEVFGSFLQEHNNRSTKERSKLLKHHPSMLKNVIPSTDPISTFAAFNTWVTTQEEFGHLTPV